MLLLVHRQFMLPHSGHATRFLALHASGSAHPWLRLQLLEQQVVVIPGRPFWSDTDKAHSGARVGHTSNSSGGGV